MLTRRRACPFEQIGGPIWSDPIHDPSFVSKIVADLQHVDAPYVKHNIRVNFFYH